MLTEQTPCNISVFSTTLNINFSHLNVPAYATTIYKSDQKAHLWAVAEE